MINVINDHLFYYLIIISIHNKRPHHPNKPEKPIILPVLHTPFIYGVEKEYSIGRGNLSKDQFNSI